MTAALNFWGVRTADGGVMANPDSMVQEAEANVSQFTTESHRICVVPIISRQALGATTTCIHVLLSIICTYCTTSRILELSHVLPKSGQVDPWSNTTGQHSNTLLLSRFSRVRLCDPIDGSPPGSPIPGILQARTLEWVAISFSNAWKWNVKGKSLSCVRLLATPWTTAYQAPPSIGFSRQKYWSGVPLPSPSNTLYWWYYACSVAVMSNFLWPHRL